MKAILVRVGIDKSYGGWNAPVDPDSRRFLYVPIPDGAKSFHPGCERLYDEVREPLLHFLSGCKCEKLLNQFPIGAMQHQAMHLDPDFEHLTYGDDGARRGLQIKTLSSGDLLVFYAGLRSIQERAKCLVYAIVGLFVVDEVVAVSPVGKDRWHENAHTRKTKWGESDIIVRARSGVSGRCTRCVPIGEYRDRAYRVRRELLDEWGGLSVNDGYIQRSVRPPMFQDADRFYSWWQDLAVELTRKNF